MAPETKSSDSSSTSRENLHPDRTRNVWYLKRHHDGRAIDAAVYRILKRHGLNRLPAKVGRRTIVTKRYQKRKRGHHMHFEAKCWAATDKNAHG